MSEPEVIVGIGGAAGDGTASAGNTLVLSMARQGIAGYSYNSYQSVIRGGHSWLRLRFSAQKPLNHGDQVKVLIALNQDSLDRHLQELPSGGVCLYNGAKFQPSYDPRTGFGVRGGRGAVRGVVQRPSIVKYRVRVALPTHHAGMSRRFGYAPKSSWCCGAGR